MFFYALKKIDPTRARCRIIINYLPVITKWSMRLDALLASRNRSLSCLIPFHVSNASDIFVAKNINIKTINSNFLICLIQTVTISYMFFYFVFCLTNFLSLTNHDISHIHKLSVITDKEAKG
jgi:hypothetical protein